VERERGGGFHEKTKQYPIFGERTETGGDRQGIEPGKGDTMAAKRVA